MTIQQLFIRSNQELKKVIDQIKDDQWELIMPAGVTRESADLLGTINYHTFDDAWVPDVLDGKTKEEVGLKYNDLRDTAADQAIDQYDKYNAIAVEAVQALTDLDKKVHLSYGDFSAHDYLQHIISFRGFRTFDIAKVIGADTQLAEDLVQGLWEEFSPIVEQYRQMGVFPPAIEVADDADPQTKLLALVGRA